MRQIILASGSPRRKLLLEKTVLNITVVPSDFDEWLDDTVSPETMAVTLAKGKAKAIARRYPEAIVIGSDTIVSVGTTQLGKARDIDEARSMWHLVTSGQNKITSSLVVLCEAEDYEYVTFDTSYVTFRPYEEIDVESYLATDDWKDKAGAWSLQQCRRFMRDIEGDEDTILGLPTRLMNEPLQHFGY